MTKPDYSDFYIEGSEKMRDAPDEQPEIINKPESVQPLFIPTLAKEMPVTPPQSFKFVKGIALPLAYTVPIDQMNINDTFIIPDNELDKQAIDYLMKRAAALSMVLVQKKDNGSTAFICFKQRPSKTTDTDKTEMVLALLRKHSFGVRFSEMKRALNIDIPTLKAILADLLNSGIVKMEKSKGVGRSTLEYILVK